MAQVRIMYWKEIPVQIKTVQGSESYSKLLDKRFQAAVDAIAMMDGSISTDEYIEAWQWGEPFEKEGSITEAANIIAKEYNTKMPTDFVSRIRDLSKKGKRNSKPGAIDHWLNENNNKLNS